MPRHKKSRKIVFTKNQPEVITESERENSRHIDLDYFLYCTFTGQVKVKNGKVGKFISKHIVHFYFLLSCSTLPRTFFRLNDPEKLLFGCFQCDNLPSFPVFVLGIMLFHFSNNLNPLHFSFPPPTHTTTQNSTFPNIHTK